MHLYDNKHSFQSDKTSFSIMAHWPRNSLSEGAASYGGSPPSGQQQQPAAPLPTTLAYSAPSDCLALQQGPCPSGTLSVEFRTTTLCPGFDPGCSVIALIYKIPNGVQHNYHPHPGMTYEGTHRVAYLPDNIEGRQLLTRYQISWLLGRSLDVGYSVARKKDHQVRWIDSVPHKTSLTGGLFGFPDDTFLSKANEAMDEIGIPPANQCEKIIPCYDATSNEDFVKQVYSLMHLPKPLTLEAGPSTVPEAVVTYEAPLSFSCGLQPIFKTLQRIDACNIQHNDSTLCLVCLHPLLEMGVRQREQQALMQTEPCQHTFHGDCIMEYMQRNTNCPTCQTAMQGKGPSGTMSIRVNDRVCPGFDNNDVKTIELRYEIPSGIQADYHETPSMKFDGARRTAYLPSNEEGRNLLQRLKYAFQHGFTFRIGTSLTSGLAHQTTWTTIPHKTSLSGGEFGFPDNHYIAKCNQALDALNIPMIQKKSPMKPLSPGPIAGPTAEYNVPNAVDTSLFAPAIPHPISVPKHLAPAVAIPLDAVVPTDLVHRPFAQQHVPSAPPPPIAPLAPSESNG